MNSALEFARPEALFLLLVLPLLAWWTLRAPRPRLRIPGAALVSGSPATGIGRLRWVPLAVRLLALALVVVALARPRERTTTADTVDVEGIDIVVALDVSTSMLAADFRPRNRLHVAKEVLEEFVAQRPDDRIGLVVFAGEAYTQAPLTLDHGVLTSILESVRTGVIEDGTAVGNALATSLNRLAESDAKSRVVILITDGDNNAGNIAPRAAAAIAHQQGVRVYTILVGRGGQVPYPVGEDPWGRTRYRKVEIPVNPQLLESLAEATGGASYVATDKETLARGFQQILDELEKTRLVDGGVYVHFTERFPQALLPALMLVFLELVLSATVFRTFP